MTVSLTHHPLTPVSPPHPPHPPPPQRHDPSRRASRSTVAAALSIFRESFDLIAAPVSDNDHSGGVGGVSLAEAVLFAREPTELGQLDLGEFRVVVLRRGGCALCAGVVRVHGGRFAEMPFVATKEGYR